MDYPYDIITEFSRSKSGGCKTFSILANLIPQTEESPLKIFNSMSRFTTTIIQNGTAASINLHPSDLAQMRAVSDYAMNKYYDTKYNVSGTISESENPAFTARFMSGKLKGKTPADVLIENKALGRKILNDQSVSGRLHCLLAGEPLCAELIRFPHGDRDHDQHDTDQHQQYGRRAGHSSPPAQPEAVLFLIVRPGEIYFIIIRVCLSVHLCFLCFRSCRRSGSDHIALYMPNMAR